MARAAAAVAVGIALLWLAFGAAPWDVVRYLAYEIGYVALPGAVAFCALAPRRREVLTIAAAGWALGYALELGAFALTGAVDARGLYPLYPLVVLAVAGPVAWRGRRRAGGGGAARAGAWAVAPRGAWAVAAVTLLAALYLAGGYFTIAPEPGGSRTVAYYPDFAFHISLAAEAKHHWPLEDPGVAGHALHYHTFVHMHMAAVSDVTGVELHAILFRFLPLTLLALVALQMAALGRRFGGPAAAALAVALALCAGELDLDPDRVAPFGGNLFRSLFLSPSMLFGLALLLPIAMLVVDSLRARRPEGGGGEAVVLVALLAAAAGAKAAILPLVIGGLAFTVLWCALAERRLDRGALGLLGLAAAVFLATYAVLYSGGGEGGLELGVFAMFDSTVISEVARRPGDGLGGALLWVVAGPLTLALLCLPLAGAAFVVAERGPALGPERAFLAGLFLGGLFLALVLRHPAGGQLYFLFYGYLAALPLAAEGWVALWRRLAGRAPGAGRALALAAAGVLALALVLTELVRLLDPPVGAAYAVAYGVVAIAVALAAVRAVPGARRVRWFAALGLLAAVTALDAPIDWLRDPVARAARGDSPYTGGKADWLHGMDPDLLAGLRWIRSNTGEDAVLAVNNHWTDTANTHPLFDYYSAFAERRVYLQSWLYTPETYELGYARVKSGALPFPDRLALNDGAFTRPALLARLRADGVTHLVVDRLNGPPAPAAPTLGEPLYENPSVAVYDLP